MDVSKWLEAAGFGRFADLFESQEIDAEALRSLTEAHLKELGLPLGARVKLQQAIAELNRTDAANRPAAAPYNDLRPPEVLAPLAAAAAPAAPLAPVTPTGERRQLTIVFVDLVGSTALSGELDPEDLRVVVRGYQHAVSVEIERLGGHVAQYLGDGVLAYFGYPVAHESEAERAVRASVAIQAAVSQRLVSAGRPLAVRIGLATGLVVVGDMLGVGAHRELAVVGETPNLAARLQSLAKPGQIVIANRTRELLGSAFDVVDIGEHALAGIAVPQRAFVVGAERTVSRFEAQSGERITPMVGREFELGLMLERWRTACTGQAQVVLITGDAGIGKSRLVRALLDVLAGQRRFTMHLQCSPYHTESMLYPSIQQIRHAAGLDATVSRSDQLDRLESVLASPGPHGRAHAPVVAALLGIDGSERYGPLNLDLPDLRRRTLEALLEQVVLHAQQQPLLLVLEDAHWVDPTSLELLDLCTDRIAALPVMVLITSRPGFAHELGDRCDVTRVVLNRLGRVQIAELTSRVAGGKSLPEALVREITSKTDGVPLFAEEIVRTLLQSGALTETADAYVLRDPLHEMEVPASLQDSLMARLDKLQHAKEVAQAAACIGREFDVELMSALVAGGDPLLQDALQRLVQAELISARGMPPHNRYAFRHALVRDAAYNSLLRTARQQMHAWLLAALEKRPDTAPELLAHHAVGAGQLAQAVDWYTRAAQKALGRPAYREAVAHFRHALSQAEQLGDAPPWPERRLGLLLAAGTAAIPAMGYGHPETIAAFERAQRLDAAMGGTPHRFAIAYALWVSRYVRGEQDQALGAAREMMTLSQLEGAPVEQRVAALRALAIQLMITGEAAQCLALFEQAAALVGPQRPAPGQRGVMAQRYAADPWIAARLHHALTLLSQGQVDAAVLMNDEAVAEAAGMNHPHTLCTALGHRAIQGVMCHDAPRTVAAATELLALAEEHDLLMWKGYGNLLHGCGCALAGRFGAAAPLMEAGFLHLARTQTGAMMGVHHGIYACVLAQLGRFEEAAVHAAAVRAELSNGSERFFWPECLRLLGHYLLLCTDSSSDQVMQNFEQAMQIAAGQGTRAWHLHAALSTARVLADRGDTAGVRALLAPALQGLVPTNSLRAIGQAQQLLAAQDSTPSH